VSLDSLKGQAAAVAALKAALESGRIPNAFLFAGPSGVGKSLAAFEVARALLCRKGPKSACQACASCRRVESRAHADLFRLAPEREGASIGIDQVRGLCASLFQSPMESLRKVAVIDGADELTEPAQNALLKTLEEPPADTYIILVAENTDALLATVRSRCRRIDFLPVPDADVAAFLAGQGIDKAQAASLARLAGGSFGAALALCDGSLLELRAELIPAVLAARPADVDSLAERIASGGAAGKGKKAARDRRQDASVILASLHSVLADCIKIKAGAAVRANADLAAQIAAFASARDFDELSSLEKEVSDGIILLGYYVDARLVATRIVAAFAKARAPSTTQSEAV